MYVKDMERQPKDIFGNTVINQEVTHMKNDSQFLFTSDEVTKNNLTKLGFSEIPSGGSFFIFINDSTLKFDDTIPVDKIGFTNKLMF